MPAPPARAAPIPVRRAWCGRRHQPPRPAGDDPAGASRGGLPRRRRAGGPSRAHGQADRQLSPGQRTSGAEPPAQPRTLTATTRGIAPVRAGRFTVRRSRWRGRPAGPGAVSSARVRVPATPDARSRRRSSTGSRRRRAGPPIPGATSAGRCGGGSRWAGGDVDHGPLLVPDGVGHVVGEHPEHRQRRIAILHRSSMSGDGRACGCAFCYRCLRLR